MSATRVVVVRAGAQRVVVTKSGQAGAPGADGGSAYDLAVAGGFVGTEAEWLASLAGPEGPPGPGGGAVDSVNGQTGAVVLDATDVGADAAGTAAAAVAAHEASANPHPGYLTQAEGDAAYDALGAAAAAQAAAVQRANHTGTQASATISDLDASVASIVAGLALTDFPAGMARDSEVQAAVDALVAAAPGTLDTLAELAAAIGDDPNFATTLASSLAGKVDKATLDANTLLKADADDTPSALAVGASTLVGRAAAGGIAALTAAQVKTLLALAAADIIDSTTLGRSLLTAADVATARAALGLGTAALVNTGTASGDVPLLGAGGRLAIARVASGTPDGTKFVRDDGTLAVPSGGGGGGGLTPTATKTAAYTAASGDLVVCNATSAAFTVTLPAASAGARVGVKKIDTSFNIVTIDPPGAVTIDGSATYKLYVHEAAVMLVSDGTNWLVEAEVTSKGVDYTPTLGATTTPPTLGTGGSAGSTGRVQQLGRRITVEQYYQFGTSGVNAGSGTYRTPLPFTAQATGGRVFGHGYLFDSSTGALATVAVAYQDSNNGQMFGQSGGVTNAVPWTWAAADALLVSLSYEPA